MSDVSTSRVHINPSGITPENAAQMFEAALRSPIPRFYANGFINGLSQSDITTVFQCNGAPVLVMNLSYISAKSLAVELMKLIVDVEKVTKSNIMTLPEMKELQEREVKKLTGPKKLRAKVKK